MQETLVCIPNIAGPGIARRRNVAIVAGVVTVALVAALIVFDAPWFAAALVLVPAGLGASAGLQARRKTCVAHARRGTIELGDFSAHRAPEDAAAASRRVAGTIVRDAALTAVAVATLAAVGTFLA